MHLGIRGSKIAEIDHSEGQAKFAELKNLMNTNQLSLLAVVGLRLLFMLHTDVANRDSIKASYYFE